MVSAPVAAASSRGATPVHDAAALRQVECLRLLLATPDGPAIAVRCDRGPSVLASVLQMRDRYVSARPRHQAYQSGVSVFCSVLLSLLLATPGVAEARDAAGATPLYAMVEAGAVDMVVHILKHRIPCNTACVGGTAVGLEATCGRSSDSHAGNTALHAAARVGDPRIVTALLDAGADGMLCNSNGNCTS
jgi:ankyrin repeat protein